MRRRLPKEKRTVSFRWSKMVYRLIVLPKIARFIDVHDMQERNALHAFTMAAVAVIYFCTITMTLVWSLQQDHRWLRVNKTMRVGRVFNSVCCFFIDKTCYCNCFNIDTYILNHPVRVAIFFKGVRQIFNNKKKKKKEIDFCILN